MNGCRAAKASQVWPSAAMSHWGVARDAAERAAEWRKLPDANQEGIGQTHRPQTVRMTPSPSKRRPGPRSARLSRGPRRVLLPLTRPTTVSYTHLRAHETV